MNKKFNYQVILKHALAIVFMALVTLAYFSPLLDGKDVRQSDMLHFEGMSKELKDYHQTTGKYSDWTNAMFSGMTSSYIYNQPEANVYAWIAAPIQKGTPMMSYGIIFMMLVCFYIAMCLLDFNIFLALGAALAYAFCSYNLIIIEAGHVTKGYAIATIPLIISGVILVYRNKRIAGFFIFMIGLGLSLAQSHPQITYYTALAVAAYVLIAFIYAISQKQILDFFKSSVVLLIAIIFAFLPNIGNLYQSYDYSKESMRGKSELTAKANENGSGLAYDYAYAWSYGKAETFTLLIPNVVGGPSHFSDIETMEKNMPATLNTLRTKQLGQDPNQLFQKCSTYWGEQPFTSGPVYAGAIVCLLFVFSLFVIKGKMRIWAIIVFLLSIIFAWGKHFPIINDFMFNYFPMYNKFRTPSMILVLTTFIMAFVGFYGLKTLLNKDVQNKKTLNKYLYWSLGITGGLALLFAIVPSLFFDFTSLKDIEANLPEELLLALQSDRKDLLVTDAWRSFFFIVVAGIFLWLMINEKLKAKYSIIAISFLVLIDLWTVDKRYLNDDDFEVQKSLVAQQYMLTPCDAAIKQDNTLGYRVLNLAANPFNDAHASYYHHSVGGYHGAKIRRYQEFVDSIMMPDLAYFSNNISQVRSDSSLQELLTSLQSLNMLNAKYFMLSYQNPPLLNTATYGSAWFADNILWVENADEELQSLRTTNVKETAIVDKKYSEQAKNFSPQHNENSTIILTKQDSKTSTYKVNAAKNELLVFSEIFYPKYWKVSIDGKDESDKLFRANYILRAMIVPKGEHIVEFEFVPTSWQIARKVSAVSSIVIILLILGTIGYQYFSQKKQIA